MYDIKDDDIYAAFSTSGPSTSNASIEKQLPVLELVKVCPLILPFRSYASYTSVLYSRVHHIHNFLPFISQKKLSSL
jgi:hypothetical protein